jgi:hypothetical protein
VGLGVPGGGISDRYFSDSGEIRDPLDVLAVMPAQPVTLASMGTYVHTAMLPDEYGGTILNDIMHDGPHPHTQPVPDSINRDVVPEPSSVLLIVFGMAGLSAMGRHHGR